MDASPSAFKHGITIEDIEHAVHNAWAMDDWDEDLRLYIGPARDGLAARGRGHRECGPWQLGNPRNVDAREVPASALRRCTMTAKKNYGRTRSGKVITDELIDEYVKQAEDGFDVDELIRRRGGRPLIGEAPATVESVRLEPELRDALRERAERDGRTNSDVIREALRRYLQAS